MNITDLQKRAERQIRDLMREGQDGAARAICELFKNTPESTHAEIVFYGKLLTSTNQYEAALRILDTAQKKNPTPATLREYETAYWLNKAKPVFRDMRSGAALSFVIDQEGIETVLDVGSGGGEHAYALSQAGKRVQCVDFGKSVYFDRSEVTEQLNEDDRVDILYGDFMDVDLSRKFDLVWCSHVLEHQPNPNLFLKRCLDLTNDGGWLAITVPPLKHQIVGGHLSLWNAGLIIYHLIFAGNDCSDAIVMNYGYNVSVLVRKRPAGLPELDFDAGDIDLLSNHFPPSCGEAFDGRMLCYSVGREDHGIGTILHPIPKTYSVT